MREIPVNFQSALHSLYSVFICQVTFSFLLLSVCLHTIANDARSLELPDRSVQENIGVNNIVARF